MKLLLFVDCQPVLEILLCERLKFLQICYHNKTGIFCSRAAHPLYEGFIAEVFREISIKKENCSMAQKALDSSFLTCCPWCRANFAPLCLSVCPSISVYIHTVQSLLTRLSIFYLYFVTEVDFVQDL
jgi:hypothetical protein